MPNLGIGKYFSYFCVSFLVFLVLCAVVVYIVKGEFKLSKKLFPLFILYIFSFVVKVVWMAIWWESWDKIYFAAIFVNVISFAVLVAYRQISINRLVSAIYNVAMYLNILVLSIEVLLYHYDLELLLSFQKLIFVSQEGHSNLYGIGRRTFGIPLVRPYGIFAGVHFSSLMVGMFLSTKIMLNSGKTILRVRIMYWFLTLITTIALGSLSITLCVLVVSISFEFLTNKKKKVVILMSCCFTTILILGLDSVGHLKIDQDDSMVNRGLESLYVMANLEDYSKFIIGSTEKHLNIIGYIQDSLESGSKAYQLAGRVDELAVFILFYQYGLIDVLKLILVLLLLFKLNIEKKLKTTLVSLYLGYLATFPHGVLFLTGTAFSMFLLQAIYVFEKSRSAFRKQYLIAPC